MSACDMRFPSLRLRSLASRSFYFVIVGMLRGAARWFAASPAGNPDVQARYRRPGAIAFNAAPGASGSPAAESGGGAPAIPSPRAAASAVVTFAYDCQSLSLLRKACERPPAPSFV